MSEVIAEVVDQNATIKVVNKELDGIFKVELNLAAAIREHITKDYNSGKFNRYELAGRLSMNSIELESMLTRTTWTLRYAILIANKLGYEVQNMGISEIS